MSDLYIEGNHPAGVRAICKECETIVLKSNEAEAQEVVKSHNQARHNGNDVAGVCAWDLQPLVTDDMGLSALLAISDALDDDLSPEEMQKVLGLVGDH